MHLLWILVGLWPSDLADDCISNHDCANKPEMGKGWRAGAACGAMASGGRLDGRHLSGFGGRKGRGREELPPWMIGAGNDRNNATREQEPDIRRFFSVASVGDFIFPDGTAQYRDAAGTQAGDDAMEDTVPLARIAMEGLSMCTAQTLWDRCMDHSRWHSCGSGATAVSSTRTSGCGQPMRPTSRRSC